MNKINRSEEEWKRELTEEEYEVLRRKGTEAAFSGKYYDFDEEGVYHCKACGVPLFTSAEKFHSGSGWPSFYEAAHAGNIKLQKDTSHGMERVEVICASCGSHLGHLFEDGPADKTGKRYCINSVALDFNEQERT